MKTGTSTKISENVRVFLKKFRTNRRKTEIDESDLSYSGLLEIVVKYFKNNNDKYLELIKIPAVKNV